MKGRLKFRRPFVVLDKKKTGGENFLKKVFSPSPPLSKTFDVIESLFIAFLILTASGSPPDFFVGKEMLILFARFLRIEAFTPFQSQTKRQDPSFSSGCHFEKTANRDSIRGKVLEGRGEGRGKLSPESFPLPSPTFIALESLFLHPHDEVGDAVGVAPFVVVPRDNLGELSVLHGAGCP